MESWLKGDGQSNWEVIFVRNQFLNITVLVKNVLIVHDRFFMVQWLKKWRLATHKYKNQTVIWLSWSDLVTTFMLLDLIWWQHSCYMNFVGGYGLLALICLCSYHVLRCCKGCCSSPVRCNLLMMQKQIRWS